MNIEKSKFKSSKEISDEEFLAIKLVYMLEPTLSEMPLCIQSLCLSMAVGYEIEVLY